MSLDERVGVCGVCVHVYVYEGMHQFTRIACVSAVDT